jgi:hypothetical protein
LDRTGENRLKPGQDYRQGVAVRPNVFSSNVPVVTAAVFGRFWLIDVVVLSGRLVLLGL